MVEKIKKMPSWQYLNGIDRGDLATAINSQGKGSFAKFAIILGLKPTIQTAGYWTEEKILEELKTIYESLQKMPNAGDLKKIGQHGLRHAINKNGGFSKFGKLLGFNPKLKPSGYWTEEKVIEELKPICKQLEKMPSWNDLIRLKRLDLAHAINRGGIGSFAKFAKLLGFKPNLKE